MLTINAYTVTLTTRPRTRTTIGRSYAADEPSHLHIPRPSRVMRADEVPDGCTTMHERYAIKVLIT